MFEGKQIIVHGFQIPSDAPLFLIVLSIHILAGLTCVLTGVVAMFAKKHHGLHSKAGSIYYGSLWVVFITVTIISILRWKEDYYLFILGLISFCLAFTARKAIRKKWRRWAIIHIICMGLSYVFLITGFYVDNGKFLPVWKQLNPLVYWSLPGAIGVPIIIGTLLRHPLSRNYFKRNN